MKTKVVVSNEPEYPKLMVSALGRVVLFTSKTEGTLLGFTDDSEVDQRHREPIGHHSAGWDYPEFKPLKGKVVVHGS